MHMIRNAIDHGIEDRDERMRVGKPPVGTIALNAFQKGNHVVIEVEDDGKGMDPAVIVAVALRARHHHRAEAREMSAKEVLALVFQPGFTTPTGRRRHELSGRGVGMDIVRTNIAKLGGVVDITSEVGIGTKMTITLPITLAIISVLIVEVGSRCGGSARSTWSPPTVALGPDAPAHFLGVARPGDASQTETIVLLDPGALLP
jgi:two-component system, chemotaxis family, sensor kinase CheA